MHLLALLWLATLTTGFTLPHSSPIGLLPDPSTLDRRADQNENLEWTLRPHYDQEDIFHIVGYSISVGIETDWDNGLEQQNFALNLDTASSKTWVVSSLIPEDGRHVGRVYYPPKRVQERFAAGLECGVPYEYGSGTLRVVPFETKITAASRALEAFPIGAAFETTGKFREYPSSVIGDGIFGLSPSGATLALSKMGLGNDARQFVFDASREKLSLEQLDPADPAFRWLDGAVRVYSELVDYWVIPDSLSSVGPAVVDTGATDIFLSDDQVEAYFASYPEGTYMEDEGDDLIACDDTDSLPRLEILLGKEESEEPRIDCGLSAQQLRANLALTTSAGKRFCYTSLQRMSTAGDEDGHGALLGLAWLQHYQVAFDAIGKRIGVRSA